MVGGFPVFFCQSERIADPQVFIRSLLLSLNSRGALLSIQPLTLMSIRTLAERVFEQSISRWVTEESEAYAIDCSAEDPQDWHEL
jgi:hypothetical protein